jgi:hypothetical protein
VRAGYQPACKNEWQPGVCRKPKVKCAKCGAREFIPVTDDVIRQHLSGMDRAGKPFVMGGYPLREDESEDHLHRHFLTILNLYFSFVGAKACA